MRQYTQGIRNFLQSEFGQSFINAYETISEKHTVRILTDVAISLDKITGLVQTSITLAHEGIAIGKQALAVGQAAQATSLEALTVARSALGVSESNSKRLGHVEKRFIEVEKTVMALKKGQVVSDGQIKKFIADVAELRAEIVALRDAAALAARIAEEHARLTAQTTEIARRVAEIEAWRAVLEARGA